MDLIMATTRLWLLPSLDQECRAEVVQPSASFSYIEELEPITRTLHIDIYTASRPNARVPLFIQAAVAKDKSGWLERK